MNEPYGKTLESIFLECVQICECITIDISDSYYLMFKEKLVKSRTNLEQSIKVQCVLITSVIRLGDFSKFLVTIFLAKVAQMNCDYLGCFENIHFHL